MQPRSILTVLMLGSLLAGGGVAAAADTKSGNDAATSMAATAPGNDSNHGMMHGAASAGPGMAERQEMTGAQGLMGGPGMMGGQGMMCGQGMMGMMNGPGHRMSGGAVMPQLPPGNERLQLKMQGEMMQRMGEILSKYADQVKEGATPGR